LSDITRNSKVLVTGADGFIGSHLTESLVRAGYDVRAFVYYNSFNSLGWLDNCSNEVKNKFEVFAGDIRDPYGTKKAMKDCEAVLHLAALEASNGLGEVFNLGSNFEISISKTAELIADAMGSQIEIIYDNLRVRPSSSEVGRLWSDNSKAKEFLKWRPNFSGLEGFIKGINETIKWYIEPNNMSKYKPNIYNL